MATKRKNSTRTGWDSVVERLSAKPTSEGKAGEVGAGHPPAVDRGKQGRSRSVVSNLELDLMTHLRAHKIVGYTMEYRFHPTRRWRFDFCWILKGIAVEVEGGTWSGGRHTTGAGFEKDCEKYNEAMLMGFRIFRFTGAMIRDGRAINTILEALNGTS